MDYDYRLMKYHTEYVFTKDGFFKPKKTASSEAVSTLFIVDSEGFLVENNQDYNNHELVISNAIRLFKESEFYKKANSQKNDDIIKKIRSYNFD